MNTMGTWLLSWCQNIIDGIGNGIQALINLLPASPFTLISNSAVSQYMGYLNWIVPVDQIIVILQLWVSAIIIYYIYVVILRWIKAIQ